MLLTKMTVGALATRRGGCAKGYLETVIQEHLLRMGFMKRTAAQPAPSAIRTLDDLRGGRR